MTPGEFKEIAKAMQEFGISYVKMRDCEISRVYNTPPHTEIKVTDTGVPIQSNDPIKHRVDQMTSLMKLSDTELIDQLWPDKTDEIA